jgi:hypothetical protein
MANADDATSDHLSESERATRAVLLGIALGVLLAMLGRRR